MDVAFAVTDRITVLHYGRVVADGLARDVKANPLVQEIYLGALDAGLGAVGGFGPVEAVGGPGGGAALAPPQHE
jgi:hypothetical protein